MARSARPPLDVDVRPVDASGWPDVERLFGPAGGVQGGCWCMFFRLSGREFKRRSSADNRAAFQRLVEDGEPTGVLAYDGDDPVGWAALAPRRAHPRLARSPLRVGDLEDPTIWSMLCFYVTPKARRRGVGHPLVEGACAHAAEQGADVVEALPLAEAGQRSSAERYVGTRKLFAAHGFVEVPRSSTAPTARIVMRRTL